MFVFSSSLIIPTPLFWGPLDYLSICLGIDSQLPNWVPSFSFCFF